jgi:hypothetical protein
MMMNARNQAESYAKALPADHGWPPFIIICDVADSDLSAHAFQREAAH